MTRLIESAVLEAETVSSPSYVDAVNLMPEHSITSGLNGLDALRAITKQTTLEKEARMQINNTKDALKNLNLDALRGLPNEVQQELKRLPAAIERAVKRYDVLMSLGLLVMVRSLFKMTLPQRIRLATVAFTVMYFETDRFSDFAYNGFNTVNGVKLPAHVRGAFQMTRDTFKWSIDRYKRWVQSKISILPDKILNAINWLTEPRTTKEVLQAWNHQNVGSSGWHANLAWIDYINSTLFRYATWMPAINSWVFNNNTNDKCPAKRIFAENPQILNDYWNGYFYLFYYLSANGPASLTKDYSNYQRLILDRTKVFMAFGQVPDLAKRIMEEVLHQVPKLATESILQGDPVFRSSRDADRVRMPLTAIPSISSPFGSRYGKGISHSHKGTDFSVRQGTPLYAPFDSLVSSNVDDHKDYGMVITLNRMDSGLRKVPKSILLGHLSGRNVKAGEKVAKGELIGWSGLSGRATGPHLHLEATDDKDINNFSDFMISHRTDPESYDNLLFHRLFIP